MSPRKSSRKRTVAPRKRGGKRLLCHKTHELERGDVIYWEQARQVVLEVYAPDEERPHYGVRLSQLTPTGKLGATRTIFVSGERSFVIAEHVDLD